MLDSSNYVLNRSHRRRCLIYFVDLLLQVIEVEFKGDRNASYQDFLSQMKDLKDQCRYESNQISFS